MVVPAAARSWGSRGAVIVAALACVATSQPRWELEAAMPAGLARGGGKGVLLSVESSRAPDLPCSVTTARAAFEPSLSPPEIIGQPWPGHVDFLRPPEATMIAVRIKDLLTLAFVAVSVRIAQREGTKPDEDAARKREPQVRSPSTI